MTTYSPKLLALIFVSQQSWSANLFYSDKAATFSKDERIESILIHNNSSPSVSLHSANMSCHIQTKTIDEVDTVLVKNFNFRGIL